MIKIQPHHVNRGKFHLNKKGSTVLKVILPNQKFLGFLTGNLKIIQAET